MNCRIQQFFKEINLPYFIVNSFASTYKLDVPRAFFTRLCSHLGFLIENQFRVHSYRLSIMFSSTLSHSTLSRSFTLIREASGQRRSSFSYFPWITFIVQNDCLHSGSRCSRDHLLLVFYQSIERFVTNSVHWWTKYYQPHCRSPSRSSSSSSPWKCPPIWCGHGQGLSYFIYFHRLSISELFRVEEEIRQDLHNLDASSGSGHHWLQGTENYPMICP